MWQILHILSQYMYYNTYYFIDKIYIDCILIAILRPNKISFL